MWVPLALHSHRWFRMLALRSNLGLIHVRMMGIISTQKRDVTDLIMWLALFLGIMALAFIRLQRLSSVFSEQPTYFDILFIGLYLLWMIVELRVTKKDVNTEGKKTYDFMTCQLYGAGQALTILTALWFPSFWRESNAAHVAGLGIFLFGVCYRLWAIRTLGKYYSHRVRTVDHHQIVVSGPYSVIRHPAYAGMIIANAGVSICFFNWVTICVFLFILTPAIILRIIIEEKTLFRIDGYAEFARNRKRLIPAIW